MNGEWVSKDKLSDCDPIKTVGDLWNHQKFNLNKKPLGDNVEAIPCGLVAKSIFNDTFELWDPNNKKVDIKDKDIAWKSDI